MSPNFYDLFLLMHSIKYFVFLLLKLVEKTEGLTRKFCPFWDVC